MAWLAAAVAQAAGAIDLVVEARQTWNAAILAGSPLGKLRLMRDARELLRRVAEEFPESELAARVEANELLAGMTIIDVAMQIRRLEQELGPCYAAPTRACLFEAAINQAAALEETDLRAFGLAQVASTLARAGDAERARHYRDQALSIVAGADDLELIDDIREAVVLTNAFLGDYETALSQIAEIEAPMLKAWAYLDVMRAQLAHGRVPPAQEAVARFEHFAATQRDPALRAQVVAVLSVAYGLAGETEEAFLRAFDAVTLAGEIDDWSQSDVAYALIVGAVARAGETAWAWRTVSEQIADPAYRCVAHGVIAEAAAEVGNETEARRAIELADKVCPMPEEADALTEYAFVFMSRAAAILGDLPEAIEIARHIGGTGAARAWALGEIALLLPEAQATALESVPGAGPAAPETDDAPSPK